MSELKINNVSVLSETNGNISIGDVRLPASGGIKDSAGNNVLTELSSVVSLQNVDTATIGSNALVVDSSGKVGIGTSSLIAQLEASEGFTTRGIATPTNTSVGSIQLVYDGTNGVIRTWNSSPISYETYGHHQFLVDGTERMRIDGSGNLLLHGTSSGTSGAGTWFEKPSDSTMPIYLRFKKTFSGSREAMDFRHSGTQVGRIIFDNTSTTYVTSSDYRLKENITDITDGINRVKQLNPSRFNFIADPETTVDGFIAHEVSDIVPEAVSGGKDAVNEDGSIEPQGIDQSKLVPLLTAALQESIALIESQQSQIDALTARIEALENP